MNTEFDYIIIGGGSGGSVMAARLSEDPNVTVCLLEAGGEGNSALVNTPLGIVGMVPTKINNWAFETVPQKGLNGRVGYQPRGKALGGSSAINAMVYIRGHQTDYDRWAREEGCQGWSFNDVLPYFRLSEGNEVFNNEYHGQDGPLKVSQLRSDNPFQNIYLQAAKEAGFKLTTDFNGADQEGVGIYQVTQTNGERCSVARAYLFPVLKRPNLSVYTQAMVERILFEGKRATGVQATVQGTATRLTAKREVLLAAGAFQSPQLLMVSGVGDAQELQQHGIPVVHHLPGVGKNLQDHPDFVFGFNTRHTATLGISLKGAWHLLTQFLRYRKERRGLISSNFAEGGGFLKIRPDSTAPDVQLHFVIAMVDDHARKPSLGHGLSCHVCLLRPKSRGTVKLAGPGMDKAPVIDPAFLEHPDDVKDLVEGFKLTRKIMQAPALARHISGDPFTANVNTDEEIVQSLRNRVDTVYHPIGTCKMGVDSMAVVDTELRVHGLEGLRVIDASVMPSLIGGNTNAPVVMMAEKLVDLMRGQSRVAPVSTTAQSQIVASPSLEVV